MAALPLGGRLPDVPPAGGQPRAALRFKRPCGALAVPHMYEGFWLANTNACASGNHQGIKTRSLVARGVTCECGVWEIEGGCLYSNVKNADAAPAVPKLSSLASMATPMVAGFLPLDSSCVLQHSCAILYTVFIGTTTTGSSLVHFKLYWVPACAALRLGSDARLK